MMPLNLIFVVVSAATLMMTTVSSFTTSYSSQKRNYHIFHGDGLSSTTSKSSPSSPLLKAVPGSIFEDPAGWLKHKTEVMTDSRQITLYHILLKNDSTHYKPDSYLLEATTKLEEIRSQINENGNSLEAFGEAAKEYSEDVGSGKKNGLVGTFKRGQLDIHVDDAAFNGEIGQIIGPVKSYYGLHLLWVSDRTE